MCRNKTSSSKKVALFQGIVCYFGELLDLTSCWEFCFNVTRSHLKAGQRLVPPKINTQVEVLGAWYAGITSPCSFTWAFYALNLMKRLIFVTVRPLHIYRMVGPCDSQSYMLPTRKMPKTKHTVTACSEILSGNKKISHQWNEKGPKCLHQLQSIPPTLYVLSLEKPI